MANPYPRLNQTRRWLNIVCFMAMFGGIVIVALGWLRPGATLDSFLTFAVAGFGFFILGAVASGLGELLLKIEANSHRLHELLLDSRATQDEHYKLLETIRDNSQISDGVKSITHREVERDALRKAIREEILKEDWEAAYNLIEDMERRFGYRVEAYSYRKEVDEFRARVIEDKLQASLRLTRELIRDRKWEEAHAEIQRLQRLAQQDSRVSEVLQELDNRKTEHKNTLLAAWHEAVEREDVDRAIELLKEIDPYLTREEARKHEDLARRVVKARIVELGVQFRKAVTEKRWDDAIKVGDTICTEFPNSLMAREVGESSEALRTRASSAKMQA